MTDTTAQEAVVQIPEDAVDFTCTVVGEDDTSYKITYEYNGHEDIPASVPKDKVFEKNDHGLIIDNSTITNIQLSSGFGE